MNIEVTEVSKVQLDNFLPQRAAVGITDGPATVEERLAAVEAELARMMAINDQLLRTVRLVGDVLARSAAELAAAES